MRAQRRVVVVHVWLLPAIVCLLTAISARAWADGIAYQPISGATPQPLPAVGPSTEAEMEAFVDGWMSWKMASTPIAGAAVAVVKDGKLFFAKGYGYQDVARRVPVDPSATVFRVGSISKVITWIAVLQLVEAGKLSLDVDVNRYLRTFKIPETYPQPVTLRNLMTHTAGFEDGGLGYLEARSQKDLIPLGKWLAEHIPARVRPPTRDFSSSTQIAYSNWGGALAGYIVEQVSGMPYDEYVEKNVFEPLGMTDSTFEEPLPPRLADRLSCGYSFTDNRFVCGPFEFIHNDGPAGALSTTATDMAKLEMALLQGGSLGSVHILQPWAAQLFETRALSPDPALNAMTSGLFETWLDGTRIIGHGGDTLLFHAEFEWVPAANLGLFVAFNTEGCGGCAIQFFQDFYRHYFPAVLPVVKPPGDAAAANRRVAGTYWSLRRSYTKIDKLLSLADQLTVGANTDGTLSFPDPLTGTPEHWVEVGNGVFRANDRDIFVAFKGPEGGRADYLVGSEGDQAFDRVPWFALLSVQEWLLAACVILFISTIVSTVRTRSEGMNQPPWLRWSRWTLASAAALFLGFGVLLVMGLSVGIYELGSGVPTILYVTLALPLVAIVPTLSALRSAVLMWWCGKGTLFSRLHYTAAAIFAVIFLCDLYYWNLLGYHFG